VYPVKSSTVSIKILSSTTVSTLMIIIRNIYCVPNKLIFKGSCDINLNILKQKTAIFNCNNIFTKLQIFYCTVGLNVPGCVFTMCVCSLLCVRTLDGLIAEHKFQVWVTHTHLAVCHFHFSLSLNKCSLGEQKTLF